MSRINNKTGQVIIETTLFFVALISFLLIIVRIWVWSNNQLAIRQQAYNKSRVAAGTVASRYADAPLIWVVEDAARGDRRISNPEQLTSDWVFRDQYPLRDAGLPPDEGLPPEDEGPPPDRPVASPVDGEPEPPPERPIASPIGPEEPTAPDQPDEEATYEEAPEGLADPQDPDRDLTLEQLDEQLANEELTGGVSE